MYKSAAYICESARVSAIVLDAAGTARWKLLSLKHKVKHQHQKTLTQFNVFNYAEISCLMQQKVFSFSHSIEQQKLLTL